MITDALLSFVSWVVVTVVGWFPVIQPPAWIGNVGNLFSTVFQGASSMGAWAPVGLMLQTAAVVLACILAGFAIKVVRWLLSYFLGGGGSSG